MAHTLFIVNDPPYDTERAYNALRLATTLTKREGEQVRVFLMAGAVAAARAHQTLPQGHYNLEIMLHNVLRRGGEVALCGSCMDARGIADGDVLEGARRSSMDELADWTAWSDRVLVF